MVFLVVMHGLMLVNESIQIKFKLFLQVIKETKATSAGNYSNKSQQLIMESTVVCSSF